jgi:hypothetical protein
VLGCTGQRVRTAANGCWRAAAACRAVVGEVRACAGCTLGRKPRHCGRQRPLPTVDDAWLRPWRCAAATGYCQTPNYSTVTSPPHAGLLRGGHVEEHNLA